MKIAIDLRSLQIGHQNRGIGTYLLNLLENIYAPEDTKFVFLRYNSSNPIEDFGINVANYEEIILKHHKLSRDPKKLLIFLVSRFYPIFLPLRRHRPDVFLQCDYLLRAPRFCKTVVIAHDLIPIIFKQKYLPDWSKYLHLKQLRYRTRLKLVLRAYLMTRKHKKGLKLLRRASKVIAVSQNTADDLTRIARVKKSRIIVVHSAGSFRNISTSKAVSTELQTEIDHIKNQFIIYVGGTDIRRQVDELVQAFNLYNARVGSLDLVLCGNEFQAQSKEINPKAKQAIMQSSYFDNIHMLGKVSEAEKAFVLSRASAFIFPTLYEGFGLPILEAMECGTPVITYKNSCIPEVGGNAVLYVSQENGLGIYESIVTILNDHKLSKSLTTKGHERAKNFSWGKTGQLVWKEVIN